MASVSKERQARHPDAPWLWRADWARAVVRSGARAELALAWLFAIGFCGLSTPLLWRASEVLAEKGWGVLAVALLFPLAGIGCLGWAVLATLRWRRFGKARVALETLPGVVGGRFLATFHAGTTIDSLRGFRVRLTCLKRRKRGNETRTSVAWEHEQHVAASAVSRGPFGTAVPVRFEIPHEAPATRLEPEDGVRFDWQLEVGAALAGTDLRTSFEVPIFRTSESSETVTERVDAHAAEPERDGIAEEPPEARACDLPVRETRLPDGGLELFFPPGRDRRGALALALVTLGWLGGLAVAARALAGSWTIYALVPFALVGLLLAFLAGASWLQATHLRARRGELAITRSWLGPGRTRVYRGEQIEAIEPEISGHVGRETRYRLRLVLQNGRRRLAASDIRSKQEALRLARALWGAVHRGELRESAA